MPAWRPGSCPLLAPRLTLNAHCQRGGEGQTTRLHDTACESKVHSSSFRETILILAKGVAFVSAQWMYPVATGLHPTLVDLHWPLLKRHQCAVRSRQSSCSILHFRFSTSNTSWLDVSGGYMHEMAVLGSYSKAFHFLVYLRACGQRMNLICTSIKAVNQSSGHWFPVHRHPLVLHFILSPVIRLQSCRCSLNPQVQDPGHHPSSGIREQGVPRQVCRPPCIGSIFSPRLLIELQYLFCLLRLPWWLADEAK